MAALRERRRDLRSGLVVVCEGTGLDLWASPSVRLMLGGSCFGGDVGRSGDLCWPVFEVGPVSLTSGERPAMDVSGIFALRGGGGAESREWGWYSVAVESVLLACRC